MSVQWVGWIAAGVFFALCFIQQALWQATIRQWERSSKAAFDGWQKALDGWKLMAEQYGAHLDAEIKRLEERK